jgi:hypothetical protein
VWIFFSLYFTVGLIVESLVCIKFGREEFKDIETPPTVILSWALALLSLTFFSVYRLAYGGVKEKES